jgi:hypothetical protein
MMQADPSATRPRFAEGYGISPDPDGMLPWSWASERLQAGRSFWVATTRPDGRPHAMPVWGVWLDGAVVFGAAPTSRKARNLARNPSAVVHLESGDEVVILEGEIEPVAPDEHVADAYHAKYDWRPEVDADDKGGWYRLRPTIAYAWREHDYPRSATRFQFAR